MQGRNGGDLDHVQPTKRKKVPWHKKAVGACNLSKTLTSKQNFTTAHISIFTITHSDTHTLISNTNIQHIPRTEGGSQKFLGHFKPHLKSQISSESSKQGYIKRINLRFATKSVLSLHLCLSLSVFQFHFYQVTLLWL